jgi:hypothetical protein
MEVYAIHGAREQSTSSMNVIILLHLRDSDSKATVVKVKLILHQTK